MCGMNDNTNQCKNKMKFQSENFKYYFEFLYSILFKKNKKKDKIFCRVGYC